VKRKETQGIDRWFNRHSGSANEKQGVGADENRQPDLGRRQEVVCDEERKKKEIPDSILCKVRSQRILDMDIGHTT
jgi:hypothetical protein